MNIYNNLKTTVLLTGNQSVARTADRILSIKYARPVANNTFKNNK